MATISKYTTAKGERYRVEVFIGTDPQTGKKKRRVHGGFETKKQASVAAARMELAAADGHLDEVKPKQYLFREVYEEWWADYMPTVKESTAVKNEELFRLHVLPEFGSKRIGTITKRDVQKAVKKWAASSKAAYRRWFIFTRKIFDYAKGEGYIDKNPAENVKPPYKPRVKSGAQFWDKEQINQFLNCIDREVELKKYAMFRTYLYTGMRRGEVLALTAGDIDFNAKTISINKTLTQGFHGEIVQTPKTAGSNAVIPVDDETLLWLRRWLLQQKQELLLHGINANSKDVPVFANNKGDYRSLNTPRAWLQQIIKDNGLEPITLHFLRRSFISNLLMAGVPISTVQHLARHSTSAETLNIYAQVNHEQEREGTDALVKFMKA